jgi:hypothetical protein
MRITENSPKTRSLLAGIYEVKKKI